MAWKMSAKGQKVENAKKRLKAAAKGVGEAAETARDALEAIELLEKRAKMLGQFGGSR